MTTHACRCVCHESFTRAQYRAMVQDVLAGASLDVVVQRYGVRHAGRLREIVQVLCYEANPALYRAWAGYQRTGPPLWHFREQAAAYGFAQEQDACAPVPSASSLS